MFDGIFDWLPSVTEVGDFASNLGGDIVAGAKTAANVVGGASAIGSAISGMVGAGGQVGEPGAAQRIDRNMLRAQSQAGSITKDSQNSATTGLHSTNPDDFESKWLSEMHRFAQGL